MIKHKIIKKEVTEKESIVCDICGKEYSLNGGYNKDFIEAQEFIHIHHEGGFGSIFGDTLAGDIGSIIDVDICQHCFKKIIVDKMK